MRGAMIGLASGKLKNAPIQIQPRVGSGIAAWPQVSEAFEAIDNIAGLMASSRTQAEVRIRELGVELAHVSDQLNACELELAQERNYSRQLFERLEHQIKEASDSVRARERKAKILEDRIEELTGRNQAMEDELHTRAICQEKIANELSEAEQRASSVEECLRQLVEHTVRALRVDCPLAEAA